MTDLLTLQTEFLKPMQVSWLEKLESASRYKKDWTTITNECLMFYCRSAEAMWNPMYAKKFWSGIKLPRIRVSINKCLVSGTPVRMSDGTEKAIQDMVVGDEVVTHTGRSQKVLKTFKRQYAGGMARVTLNQYPFPIEMTDDHKMAIYRDGKLEWVESKYLQVGDSLVLGKPSVPSYQTHLDVKEILGDEAILNDEIMATDTHGYGIGRRLGIVGERVHYARHAWSGLDWQGKVRMPRTRMTSSINRMLPICPSLGRLIGWYLAEGCLQQRGIVFTMNSDEQNYAEEILALVRGIFGVTCGRIKKLESNTLKVIIGNKNIRQFFARLCPGTASEKRVPSFVFAADKEVQYEVVKAWMQGDGHAKQVTSKWRTNPMPVVTGVTVSAGLARDMTNLALACGVDTKCYFLKRSHRAMIMGRDCNVRDRYTLSMYGERAYAMFPAMVESRVGVRKWVRKTKSDACEHGFLRKIKSIERYAIEDTPVYDIEVDEDHSFLANDIISSNSFEFVAIYSPNLMWEYPVRTVKPKKKMDLQGMEALFGQGGQDPMAQQQMQQQMQMLMQAQQQSEVKNKLIAELLSHRLNYTPREQPNGGLAGQSEKAIVDALLKGRGVLAVRPYTMPGSDKLLTGAFRVRPEDLFVDPDFDTMEEARWIAIRHIDPYGEVEERFELKKGSLKGKATLESNWASSELATDPLSPARRAAGQANDNVVWYEIYSKIGPGCGNTDMESPIRDHMEKVAPKYSYIAICADVPYPLNCSTEKLRGGMTDEEVKKCFAWPVPFWADDSWPIECLDFYHNPESSWPIAPLAPGLGELKLLNFLFSWLANRTWSSSRDFWAVAGPHVEHYRQYIMDGEDQCIIPTPVSVEDINKAVTVLTQPETREDMGKLIAFVTDMFEKRVNMTPMMYGLNQDGTQNRTAEETMAKSRAVSARPEYMQKQVAGWQGRVAQAEAILTHAFIKAKDVEAEMGPAGAMLWSNLIETEDIDTICRQFEYTIEASSVRRPNRDKDIADFQQMTGLFLPIVQTYSQTSNNYEPVNALLKKWADDHDQDMEAAMIPAQTQEQQQTQQQTQQLQVAQLAADVEKTKADAMKAQADAMATQVESQGDQQEAQQELALKKEEMQAKLEMEAQSQQVKLQGEQQKIAMQLQGQQAKNQLDLQKSHMDMQVQAQKSELDMETNRQESALGLISKAQEHRQAITQGSQQHKQTMQQSKEMGKAKVQQVKATAAAKPKPSKNGSAK